MSDITLRPRGASEIVDAAFTLYRRDFGQYVLLYALATVPSVVVTLLFTGGAPAVTAAAWIAAGPAMLLSFVLTTLAMAAVIRFGSDVYLGRTADVGSTIRAIVPRLVPLLIVLVLTGIALVVGLVLLIVPAIYLIARFFAVIPVVTLEGASPLAAFGRSSTLSEDSKWRILGVLLLGYGIYFVLYLALSAAGALTGNPIAILVINAIVGMLGGPFLALLTMVLYYDQRIRREGFDVQHMTASLGGAPSYGERSPYAI